MPLDKLAADLLGGSVPPNSHAAMNDPMSITPLTVPEHVQPDVDVLVRAANVGVSKPPGLSFDRVTAWCEANSDDSGLYTCDHGGQAVSIVSLEYEVDTCDDGEIEFWARLDAEAQISDEMRVAYILSQIEGVFTGERGEDVCYYPCVCEIVLAASDGATASLCFDLRGMSFDPVEVSWLGVYRSQDECVNQSRGEGIITSLEEAKRISKQSVLDLLHRNAARRKSP